MKITKIIIATGLSVAILGFLIGALAGKRELGQLIFLIGFLMVVAGMVVLVSLGQPKGSRGAGLKIGAGGFAIAVLGVLIDFVFKLNSSVGDILFAIGAILMLGGIVFHLVMLRRSKKYPDS